MSWRNFASALGCRFCGIEAGLGTNGEPDMAVIGHQRLCLAQRGERGPDGAMSDDDHSIQAVHSRRRGGVGRDTMLRHERPIGSALANP